MSCRLYGEKGYGKDGRERSYTSYFVVRVQEQGDPGKTWSNLQAHLQALEQLKGPSWTLSTTQRKPHSEGSLDTNSALLAET